MVPSLTRDLPMAMSFLVDAVVVVMVMLIFFCLPDVFISPGKDLTLFCDKDSKVDVAIIGTDIQSTDIISVSAKHVDKIIGL